MNKVIILVLMLSLLPIQLAFAEQSKDVGNTNLSQFAISIKSDKQNYLPQQNIDVSGKVYSGNSTMPKIITISVIDPKNNIVYIASKVTDKNGNFYDSAYTLNSSGTYTIIAQSDLNKEIAKTSINVQDFWKAPPVLVTISGSVCVLVLLGVIALSSSIPTKLREVIRFFLITAITFSAISFFILNDTEIGAFSSFGLVDKEINANNKSSLNQTSGWVINIGGTKSNGYESGIQIPVFVLIFGIAGGYIRYLYLLKQNICTVGEDHRERLDLLITYGLTNKNKKINNDNFEKLSVDQKIKLRNQESKIRQEVFDNSIQDLTLLILSPILAIASYFILLQGGVKETDSYPLMAGICFASGLASDSIINKLLSLIKSKTQDTSQANSQNTSQANSQNTSQANSQK